MGESALYEAQIEYEELGLLKWMLHEYPVGLQDDDDTDVGEHTLISDLKYELDHEPDYDEDWVDYSAVNDPYTIFMDTYHHTGDLLADHGGNTGDHIVNRMIFAQIISAFEAYLSDTLINGVLNHDPALSKLVEVDTDLKKQKFTLSDVKADPDLVGKHVRKYLREILYHNLAKVDYLYNTAFGIKLLADKTVNDRLYAAVKYRHNCVHRNGRTSDGEKLTVFTKTYVHGIADDLEAIVKRIQLQMRQYW